MIISTRLLIVSSLSAIAFGLSIPTEVKAFNLTNVQVNAQVTSPSNGQEFPNGSVVAGTATASWSALISTLDETQDITLFFGYSFQHANGPVQNGTIPYVFSPGLNLVPVGSGVLNFFDLAGPLGPGTYSTSIGVSFNLRPAGNATAWHVVPEPFDIGATTLVGVGLLGLRFKRKKA